jgi:hypothetical protein
MNNINIPLVLEAVGLQSDDVADSLFPSHKYPKMALKRVVDGKSNLDAVQIATLSKLTGLSVSQLYDDISWDHIKNDDPNLVVLKSGDFTAVLDLTKSITFVSHKGTSFCESVIHEKFIPLSAYISNLNNLIKQK